MKHAALPLSILLCFFLGQNTYGEPLQPRVISREDGSAVHFYLRESNASGATKNLLIVLQGSSCESVLNISSIWQKYAFLVPEADVVAIEKYGISPGFSATTAAVGGKCPDAYLDNDDLEQRYSDLVSVINYMKGQSVYTKVIVFGGSEGGSLAILSAFKGAPIDASIAFNAGGRWFVDDVLYSMKASIPDKPARSEAIAGFRKFVATLYGEDTDTHELSGHGIGWWKSMLRNDQQRNLIEAKLPVLVIQGGGDTNVSPNEWLLLRDRIDSGANEFVSFAFFPSLDHGLRTSAGVDETEAVLSDARNWLRGLQDTKKLQNLTPHMDTLSH